MLLNDSHGTINVSVSNHYRHPSYDSEVTSQGLLGEAVEVLEAGALFSKIRQEDNYESWISTDQVCPGHLPGGRIERVREHFLKIYREPSLDSVGIRDAVIGCRLHIVGETDSWYRILLPDGTEGWAQKNGFGELPLYSTENVLSLAGEFLGYQYVWGGRSPKGFDCSGFVQTVFAIVGIQLPRDSWQQQEQNLVSHDWRDAEAADLLFFGKSPEQVTHVAIAAGDGRFIHASGWVRENSLAAGDADFSKRQLDTFISVNRFRPEAA